MLADANRNLRGLAVFRPPHAADAELGRFRLGCLLLKEPRPRGSVWCGLTVPWRNRRTAEIHYESECKAVFAAMRSGRGATLRSQTQRPLRREARQTPSPARVRDAEYMRRARKRR